MSPYTRKSKDWKDKIGKRKTIVEVKKKTEKQMRIESLQNELQLLGDRLASLKNEKSTLESYEVVGMIVTHKKYGTGLVIKCNTEQITVEFDVGKKTFLYPQAFEKEFLIPEYPDFVENLSRNNSIDSEIETVSKAINEGEEMLTALII